MSSGAALPSNPLLGRGSPIKVGLESDVRFWRRRLAFCYMSFLPWPEHTSNE